MVCEMAKLFEIWFHYSLLVLFLFFPWQLLHNLYIASSSFNYPLGGHSISFLTNIWDLVKSVRVTEIKEWGWELAGTARLIPICQWMGLERARATSAPVS